MLIALPAPLADSAAIGLPAHAHSLPRLAIPHVGAHRNHRPYNLVTRNERVLAEAPVVIDQRDIAMADTAVRDLDLDFIWLQLARIELVWKQMCTGRMHSQTMYFTHQESIPFLRMTSTSPLPV
jgi:hypothetical protein